MARSKQIIDALKVALKQRGITYRALAEKLNVSESTIKQMFASGNFKLQRLDAICDLLETDINGLLELSEVLEPKLAQLSPENERTLVTEPKLLVVAWCLVNHWTTAEIRERYDISETELITRLAKLDKMKLIELQPGNKVRLLISNNFAWQKNGPIEKYFRTQIQTEFFNTSFSNDGELRVVKNGVLSKKAQLDLRTRINMIDQLFDDVAEQERNLPLDDKHGVTMILAIRNWQASLFTDLEKSNESI